MQSVFELKGNLFTLSILHLFDTDLNRLQTALTVKVQQAPHFFYLAPIVVNVDAFSPKDIDLGKLKSLLQQLKFTVVGLTTTQKMLWQEVAQQHQLSILLPGQQLTSVTDDDKPEKKVATRMISPKIIETPIRSGQQIYAQESDLVVMAAVGNGAEVIADGNIYIYGTLRGRAIAGAQGNTQARIFCQNFQAELISISGNYRLIDASQQAEWGESVCVQYVDNKLSIQVIG